MAIWFGDVNIDAIHKRSKDTMIDFIGIEVVEVGDDYLKARMPVDHRTKQPAGLLHGGASVALSETVASLGATYCIDRAKFSCVGLEINANHVRSASSGFVYAVARPAHLGRSTHIWEVKITDEGDKLVCISRVTMAILANPG